MFLSSFVVVAAAVGTGLFLSVVMVDPVGSGPVLRPVVLRFLMKIVLYHGTTPALASLK